MPTTRNQESRQAIVDEFGEADRQVRLWSPPVNPYVRRRAELAAIIESWYSDFPADQADVIQGRQYQLEVKPCQFERELTHQAKLLAFARFQKLKVLNAEGKAVKFDPLSVFHTTLEAIRKYLGEPFLDDIAPKSRRGRRIFSAVARAQPVKIRAQAA